MKILAERRGFTRCIFFIYPYINLKNVLKTFFYEQRHPVVTIKKLDDASIFRVQILINSKFH